MKLFVFLKMVFGATRTSSIPRCSHHLWSVPYIPETEAYRIAYDSACKIVDRDGDLGIEPDGILDNVLMELARLAGEGL